MKIAAHCNCYILTLIIKEPYQLFVCYSLLTSVSVDVTVVLENEAIIRTNSDLPNKKLMQD